jgi:hypothetical protein
MYTSACNRVVKSDRAALQPLDRRRSSQKRTLYFDSDRLRVYRTNAGAHQQDKLNWLPTFNIGRFAVWVETTGQ